MTRARTMDQGRMTLGRGAWAMFAFLAVCGVLTLVGSDEVADAAGAAGVLIGSFVSGLLYIRGSRRFVGRERLAWSLIGIGMLVAAAGVLTVGVVYAIEGDAPAFGWTDMFFFVTYATIIVGFAALPHTQGAPLERWRMVLDGLIGAISVGALMWVFLLSDLLVDLSDTSPVAQVIGVTYPFLDLTVLTVAMLVLVRRSAYRFDPRLGLFTVGVVAQVLGDIAFFVSGHSGSFESAEPLYIINLTAIAAFFSSAYLVDTAPPVREYAERNAPLWAEAAPYVPAVGMLVVFVVDTYLSASGEVNRVLLAATITVGLLVIARQGVSIVENRAYIEDQRNTLVSTISHELRTPLTAIVGFVDLLREGGDDLPREDRHGMLDIVHQQADYMSRIVADLIMLARGSVDELSLQVEATPMQALVEDAIQSSGIEEASITVDCPENLIGDVDPARMQQVLVNLLTNAARYGGPSRIVRVAADGSDLIIEVHDDGRGIPRRHEVRVWDRFERGPNRLNAAIPGSGIGLAIVRAIAAAHGGTAEYTTSSTLGGACFVVRLPNRATTRTRAGTVQQDSVSGLRSAP